MRTALLVPVLMVTVACAVQAQDDKKPPRTEFSGDVGFVDVSGNTRVSTLNVGERYIRRFSHWQFTQDLGVVYGKTEGEESSNLLRSSARGDYNISDNWATYALAAFDRNRFAGIRSRFSEGVGLVARLIATDINQLNIESGFQLTQQQNIDLTDESFKSLRAAANWKHVFAQNASFFQALEFLPNLDDSKDMRINSETAIIAPLSSHVGLKFSYVVRYDNLPSMNAEGTAPLAKTDRIFSSGVQITF